MSQPVHDVQYSFEDYVAFERSSNVKHEFWAGHIYAMAGGTPEHAALAASVSGLLFAQLADGPCRVYSSDLRVRAGELVTYPDVTVVCGTPASDPNDPGTTLNPTLVVEVTSPSTDGEKLEHTIEWRSSRRSWSSPTPSKSWNCGRARTVNGSLVWPVLESDSN
jgi:Uma2 family endonuclease